MAELLDHNLRWLGGLELSAVEGSLTPRFEGMSGAEIMPWAAPLS